MEIEMKGSPLPADRKAVCEPLCMSIKDQLLEWVDSGQISLREAADIVNGLYYAFSNTVRLMEAQGLEEVLDMRRAVERDTPPEA